LAIVLKDLIEFEFLFVSIDSSTHFITLVTQSADLITVARLATFTAGDFPMIWSALIASSSHNVWQARTLTSVTVAVFQCSVGSENIALAL
jgi:hypothetical protein